MAIKVTIDTSEYGGVRLTNEQLAQVRAAVADPKAAIVLRWGKLPGRFAVSVVQTLEDVQAAYRIPAE